MVTWRCLLDALQAGNGTEIEVWVEEARGLGLQPPTGLTEALNELRRQESDTLNQLAKTKEVEDKLKFALEADDVDLLTQVVSEAESVGLRSPVLQQATARIRALHQQRIMGGAEAGAGSPSRASGSSGSRTPVG